MDDDGDWDDGEMEDWNEDEAAPTRCLFSDQIFPSAAECLAHAAAAYQLDVRATASAKRSTCKPQLTRHYGAHAARPHCREAAVCIGLARHAASAAVSTQGLASLLASFATLLTAAGDLSTCCRESS